MQIARLLCPFSGRCLVVNSVDRGVCVFCVKETRESWQTVVLIVATLR